jgi:hypothetical protein
MGYVGNQQGEGFSQVPAKQDLTGATGTSLTLSHAVASAEGIDLFINNVRQEPTTAYSIAGDGVTAVTLTGSVVAIRRYLCGLQFTGFANDSTAGCVC